jgi:hypothetical protein
MLPTRINKYLQQILLWLNPETTDNPNKNNPTWVEENLDMVKRVILMHGVGPYLFHFASEDQPHNPVPEILIGWLERLYEMNEKRIQRIHEGLHCVLRLANSNGIEVMPLKGALLTTCFYNPPYIRPMADIDLLIKPEDLKGFRSILDSIGYQPIKSESYYSNHYKFVKPDNVNIADPDTEHSDNPIPIEVHIELRRSYLGKSGEVDLTDLIWRDSSNVNIYNQKAAAPTENALLIYLATHATRHFLTQSGRILHWLDLINMSAWIIQIDVPVYIDWVYIPLKLASRAFPSKVDDIGLSEMENTVDPRILQWCARVPLDARCGLMTRTNNPQDKKMQSRFARWKPATWRLVLAFGHIPTTHAYLKYANAMLGQLPRLFLKGKPQRR